MHDGVAHQNDFGNLRLAAASEPVNGEAESRAYSGGQIGAVQHRENPAHHVGAMSGLGVEPGFDREHVA